MIKYIYKRFMHNILMFIIILFGAIFKVLAAYKIGEAFNYILKYNFKMFYELILISGIYFLFYLFMIYIKIIYQNYLIQIMLIDIRLDLVNSIEKTTYENFNKNDTGTYISWLSNDISIIEQKGFNNLYQVVTMLLESLISVFGLIFIHWSIILFTVIFSIITVLLPNIFNSKLSKKSIEYSKSLEIFVSKNTNIIQGFSTLLSFNKLSNIKKVVMETSEFVKEKSIDLRYIIALSAIFGALGNLISQFGVIALTGFLALNKIVAFGSVLTVEALVSNIFNSVGNILNFKIEIDTVKPIFEKFEKFLKNSNENEEKYIFDKNIEKIVVKDLGYNYKDKKVFSNVNCTFKRNGKYVILGKSGSGKTTFLDILGLRLTNYVGDVYINDINLKNIDYNFLKKQIVYIDQNPYIFDGSIKDNITLYEDFDDEKIYKILNKVGLSKININENASNLSGGEKQRIALVRGLIRGSKIILLDEVTSNQDIKNIEQIEKIILDDNNLTSILITHNFRKEIEGKIDGKIKF